MRTGALGCGPPSGGGGELGGSQAPSFLHSTLGCEGSKQIWQTCFQGHGVCLHDWLLFHAKQIWSPFGVTFAQVFLPSPLAFFGGLATW